VQGAYYLVTGVAPFASRRAFERVTGPKAEWWLVQATGALVAVAGAGLLSAARRPSPASEVPAMAAGWALSLAAIDAIYVARRRISPVYLVDATVQLAVLAGLSTTRSHVRVDQPNPCSGPVGGRPLRRAGGREAAEAPSSKPRASSRPGKPGRAN
jgi:hypothetical protein